MTAQRTSEPGQINSKNTKLTPSEGEQDVSAEELQGIEAEEQGMWAEEHSV